MLKNLIKRITKKLDKNTRLTISKIWIFKLFNEINPFPAKVCNVKKPTIRDNTVIKAMTRLMLIFLILIKCQ